MDSWADEIKRGREKDMEMRGIWEDIVDKNDSYLEMYGSTFDVLYTFFQLRNRAF